MLKPDVVVCLGATAAQTLLGRTQNRGELVESTLVHHTSWPPCIVINPQRTGRGYAPPQNGQFVDDLKKLAKFAK